MPKTPDLPPGQRYGWNERIGKTGGYYDFRAHRIVSPRAVDAAVDEFLAASRDAVIGYTEQLKAGALSLAEWQSRMREEIRDTHRALAAIRGGGWQNTTPADWGRVGAELRTQYRYLDRFARQIMTNRQSLDGTATSRAAMYVNAARKTGEELRRSRAARRWNEERRRLSPAEHCGDCLEFAARGWRPVGSLPPIGASVCRTNCRCVFEFR